MDNDVQEFFDQLTQDIDWGICEDGWAKSVCMEIAQALWTFEWPEMEMGAEAFGFNQTGEGTILLTYSIFQPDNDVPWEDRENPKNIKHLTFAFPVTGDPAEDQILDAIVNQYRHEVREQLLFNGEKALYPFDEHPKSLADLAF